VSIPPSGFVTAYTVRRFVRVVERELSLVIAGRENVRARLVRLRTLLLALHMAPDPLEENLERAIEVLAEPLPPATRGQ
jgi:hypothetical protein